MFHQPDLEITVQLESEYVHVGGVVRGTMHVKANKMVPFVKAFVAIRVRSFEKF
jgi:hypothetical protein